MTWHFTRSLENKYYTCHTGHQTLCLRTVVLKACAATH